jgi:hypothetical protein
MKAIVICTIVLLISVTAVGCDTGVSQEEYDRISGELARAQSELSATELSLAETQAALSDAEETLTAVQAELDAIKANPPVLEVSFIDIGEITRLTNLKLTRDIAGNSTYFVECQLELIDELPGLANVVDVELYINNQFIDSERWIDVSSSGYIITKSDIKLDTGLSDFVESITLKIIPAFKVYGT